MAITMTPELETFEKCVKIILMRGDKMPTLYIYIT